MDSTSGQRKVTRGSRPVAWLMLLAGLTVSSSTPVKAGNNPTGRPALLDLRRAVIVGPASPTLQEQTALRVLVEEVEKRTLVKLPLSAEVKGGIGSRPVIAVGTAANLKGRAGDIPGGLPSTAPPGPEGYVIHVEPARQSGRRHHRRRRHTRHVVRRRPSAARNAHGEGEDRSRGHIRAAPPDRLGPADRHRAESEAARPSARLSPEDQLLRRLGRRAVGAVHPRPRDLRHQRRRVHPADFGRRGGQSAFSASADRHDDRDVAHRRQLRSRRVDLVSGARKGLRRRRRTSRRRSTSGPRC